MVQPQTRQRRRDRTGDTSRRATGHNSQSSSAINRITSNPNLPNCKVLLVISISLVLGFILYYYYSSGGRIDDSRPISHILRDQVDQCETLVTLELQVFYTHLCIQFQTTILTVFIGRCFFTITN